MNLTSYRGITFTTLGVTSPKFAAPESPSADRQPSIIARTGADPIIPGVDMGARVMTFWFTPAVGNHVESTFAKILALCNPDDPYPGTLVGVFNPTSGTTVTVEASAQIGGWSYPDVNTLSVDFILSSPWRAQSTTNLKTLAADTVNGSFSNSNTGFRDTLPVVTVYWPAVTQRSSSTATFGWDRRIGTGEVITNTGTDPFVNQPYQIGPINHAAIVTATQGLANGNDLRVFCQGKELRRNILAANTAYCFLWVILPTVAPGETITLEILTDNPSAGTPPTLTATSTPALPAMDIGGGDFTATSSTATTVTQSGAGWSTNQWQGGTIIAPDGQMQLIASNTTTVITTANSWSPTPSGTGVYVMTMSGLKGAGSLVTSSTASTITLPGGFDGEFVGGTVHILTGTGATQTRTVTAQLGGVYSITPNWTTNPISTSTYRVYLRNGQRMYDLRTVKKTTPHKGLWLTNTSERPPALIDFDAPSSWYRFAYANSDDEFSQPRYVSYLIGGSDNDHFPVPYMQRARRGKTGTQREIGLADAIGVATPFPLNNAIFGYRMRNAKLAGSGTPGEGMCEAKFMCQESGGNSWSDFSNNKTIYSVSTNIASAGFDLTGYGSPNRLAWALVPNGSDTIPDSDSNTAVLTVSTTDQKLRLSVNPTAVMTTSVDWMTASPATVSVYDVNLIMRTGGAGSTKPYSQIVIGGIDYRIFVTGTDERIVIDCEKHTATLQTAAGVILKRIPYCLRAQYLFSDIDGTTRTVTAARWLPIPSNAIDATAIYFSDPSGAAWGSINIGVAAKFGYLT